MSQRSYSATMDNVETTQDAMDVLEALIDGASVGEVVEWLSQACFDKATHIEENWQDKPLARRWRAIAKRLYALSDTDAARELGS